MTLGPVIAFLQMSFAEPQAEAGTGGGRATVKNLATNLFCASKEETQNTFLSLTASASGPASPETGAGRSEPRALLGDVMKPRFEWD